MTKFRVVVTSRSRRPSIEICDDGSLRVRVAAPPIDGKANQAMIELLASALGIAKTSIKISVGEGARYKTVEINDLSRETILQRLQ